MSDRRTVIFGNHVTFERNRTGNKVARWKSVWRDIYAGEREVYIARMLWEKKGILLTAYDMVKKGDKKIEEFPLFGGINPPQTQTATY